MVSNRDEPTHPLSRDGTSQRMRDRPALQPDSVRLDDREITDLLVWTADFADLVTYYNRSNEPEGDWKPFWERDPSSVIAQIDAERPRLAGEPFAIVRDFEAAIREARAHKGVDGHELTDEERIGRFRDLCGQLVAAPRQVETWKSRIAEGLRIYRDLEESVESVYRPLLIRLHAYDLGARRVPGIGHRLNVDYQELDRLWGFGASDAADDSIYQGVTLDERLDYAIQRLAMLFEDMRRVYVRLIYAARVGLIETLEQWPRHEPHFALYVAFLRLFGHAQQQLNDIVRRHLDFQYETVLRLNRKDAEADRVHVFFEAARQVHQHQLSAGTAFNAGKDSIGADVRFLLQQDFVLNRGVLARQRALYVDALPPPANAAVPPPPQIVFRASPVANSNDGYGDPLDPDAPRWKAFGNDPARPGVPIGFALASPMLRLEEGKRRITADFVLSGPDLVKLQAWLEDLFGEGSGAHGRWLRVSLSTADGWFEVPQGQVHLDVLDVAAKPSSPDSGDDGPIFEPSAQMEVSDETMDATAETNKPSDEGVDGGGSGEAAKDKSLPAGHPRAGLAQGLLDAVATGFAGKFAPKRDVAATDRIPTSLADRFQGVAAGISTKYERSKFSHGRGRDTGDAKADLRETLARWATGDMQDKPSDKTLEEVVALTGRTLPVLRIIVELTIDDPPVVPLEGEGDAPPLDGQWPLLRVDTADAIPARLYHALSVSTLERVELAVEAEGMRNLVLQTDLATVAPNRPFQPFGAVPKRRSAFYVGNWEAMQKRLTRLVVRVDWVDPPPDFRDYYDGYDVGVETNRHFKGSVHLWDREAPTPWINGGEFQLFVNKGDGLIAEGYELLAKAFVLISRGEGVLSQAAQKREAAKNFGTLAGIQSGLATAAEADALKKESDGNKKIGDGLANIQNGTADLALAIGAAVLGLGIFVDWNRVHQDQALIAQGYLDQQEGQQLLRDAVRREAEALAHHALQEQYERSQEAIQVEAQNLLTSGNELRAEGWAIRGIGQAKIAQGVAENLAVGSLPLVVSMSLSGFGRDPGLQPFTGYDPNLRRGFVKIQSEQDFYHDVFTGVFAATAINSAKADGAVEAGQFPNPPYTPVAKSVSLDYEAREVIEMKGEPDRTVERFYHLHPFGCHLRWPENGRQMEGPRSLLPRYEATRPVAPSAENGNVDVAWSPFGALYLGIANLQPPENLSLLVQVVEGSADPQVPPPGVGWRYLAGDCWETFSPRGVLADRTRGLIGSGIVSFAVPEEANAEHRVLPADHVWIQAQVRADPRGLCDLVAIHAQAARLTFADRQNDPDRLASPLRANAISKPVVPDAAVKKVSQPYASFGGRVRETDAGFRRRVSERLRHRDRAVTIWDYERLVLEQFPSIHKVKCISHTDASQPGYYSEQAPGAVTVVVVADVWNQAAVDPLTPRASLATLAKIEDFLRGRVSPFVAERLRVVNPLFERIHTEIGVRFKPGQDVGFRRGTLADDLKRYLSPWAYRRDKEIGFGGTVHTSAIVDFIDERDYVDAVLSFRMAVAVDDAKAGVPVQAAVASSARSILVSAATHEIT